MLSKGVVLAVSAKALHGFSKELRSEIRLIAGVGVEGDAHAGATTQHRYLLKKDPKRKNLTQVHLIHSELFEEMRSGGFTLSAGEMGENVTTSGIELLTLPVGAKLYLGETAVVEVTGLRDPCLQLNGLHPGLMKALIVKDSAGKIVRKAGIMGVVLTDGEVRAGSAIHVEMPEKPWVEMGPV